jgi:hypothetical protein
MKQVGGNQKAPSADQSMTYRETRLGYELGYFWSEDGDFELKIGLFGAEGGTMQRVPKCCSSSFI